MEVITMIKILFIYKYAILGGVTTQLVNRFKGLENKALCHFAFMSDYGGTFAFNNYEHVYILNDKSDLIFLINSNNYDAISIIDTNEVYPWIIESEYNGLVVNEVHTTTSNIDKISELKNFPIIDLILTPSLYMKNLIENEYGFKGIIPVNVLPNCLDFSKFKYDENINPDNKNTILWIGKLDDHKRWYDFIEICNKLEKEYTKYDFEYIVIGGVTAKPEVISNLMRKVVDYNLLDKLTWYSYIGYDDMYKIYSKVKSSGGVYVSTTTNESFGMTILECMSIGLPVVVPNVGAISELIQYDNSLYSFGDLDSACSLIINQLNKNYRYNIYQYDIYNVGNIFLNIIKNI